MGELLNSGILTTTGAADQILALVGPMVVAVKLDLTDLTAGDTVVLRFESTFDAGGAAVTKSWELEMGATTGEDWVGVFGTEGSGWDSPVLWFTASGVFQIEQTVGSPCDITWEIWQL
jgi:hypothetical protein